ncbi:MAG: HD domain-containing protein [Trueperella sp.]|nr:HD domain-containing protein [Trueperella sp.]
MPETYRESAGAVAAALFAPAREFLRAHLLSTPGYSRRYRFEHSLRVAQLGREVATAAGLDPDLLALGCLLHDIGKYDAEWPVDHGRAGALLVQDFLETGSPSYREQLGETTAMQLLQGIAMHVDGSANTRPEAPDAGPVDKSGRPYLQFSQPPAVWARSIGDCDNIDRFSAYRIADTLRYWKFMELETAAQRDVVAKYLAELAAQRHYHCATAAAEELWQDNLAFQTEFFTRLAHQLQIEN